MVVENDNVLDGLTYEQALFLVCDEDVERYAKACLELAPILAKIPEGWTELKKHK
jgi:hypothetical protein